MNFLDLIVIALAISAAVGGYRLGFMARIVSWAGLAIGVVIAAIILPDLIGRLEEASDTSKLLVTVATLLGCALVGQGLGMTLGSKIHIALPAGNARQMDRTAGAIVGMLGVLVCLWLLLPTFARRPGWTADQARNSLIAAEVDGYFPPAPNTLETLGRLFGDETFPQVFDALQPAPNIGPAPAETGLSDAVTRTATEATVKVKGVACDRLQEGTGFVMEENLIVTNAHVVAGESETEVELFDGSDRDATVVAFDSVRDLAVLYVEDLGLTPLPRQDGEVGDTGGVFGHPEGGNLEISPFKIGDEINAKGKDIYDREDSLRKVLVLASELRPGDSGSALVDAEGNVIGVAFAVAPDRPNVAYALDLDELNTVLQQTDLSTPKDTSGCLV